MRFRSDYFQQCLYCVKHLASSFARSYSSQTSLHELLLKMPRDDTHAKILKSQRVKMKEKSLKYPPGVVNLQVLGSGAHGAPTSLYLFTDQSRYLFNCGEGTQRLAHEHKMKLSKLEHIFITYGSWKNIGGLPGVALTLQDVGVPQIILHGPSIVDEIFPATKRFVVLKNMEIRMASCNPKYVFEDNAIKVSYIPLIAALEKQPSSASGIHSEDMEDQTDYYLHERLPADKKNGQRSSSEEPVNHQADHNLHVHSPNVKRNRQRSSSQEPAPKKVLKEDVAMCYAVRLQPKPGALCLEKCVEAGVPPGPLLGQLKGGEDVVLSSGKIVRSADVTLAHDPGPLFLVIEVPHEKFLQNLEHNFTKFLAPETEEDRPQLVVHFTPPEVMSHPLYQKFMGGFRLGTRHLLMNDANKCLGSTAVHRVQYKLNLLDPQLFPILKDPGFSVEKNGKEKENIPLRTLKNKAASQIVFEGQTKLKIGLRPPIDSMEALQIDPDCYRSEVNKIEEFSEELSKLKTIFSNFPSTVDEYPHVVFLGTGSCIPNKTRNTSAILLTLSEECRIMLDCGEGTAGQIIRYYGYQGAAEVFSSLKAIYISHLHADHHIGLVGLLKCRPRTAPPLYLLAPSQITTWLRRCDEYFESILNSYILVPNADLLYDHYYLDDNLKEDLQSTLGLTNIVTTYVRHCPHAFGVSFTTKSGWKITYSGDTMPSEALIEIGQNSDLLIHEATMEDELVQEAKAKLHCTTSQAIAVGKKMHAKNVILTHFSQRYAKLPRIVGEDLGDNIGVAFDNMKVRFGDLPRLKYLYPALKLIFREDIIDLEEIAFKRQMRKERAKSKLNRREKQNKSSLRSK